nr:hypothetical protein [Rhodococcus sp. (in: high G+C Gram-positive bacteria)]
MSNTTFDVISEWEDEDENDGEWPYPTEYVKSVISGELADQVRKKIGKDKNDFLPPVYITEINVSGGYSEYTQENDYSFIIECGDYHSNELFDSRWYSNNQLNALLKWLED